jgi:uncharacterized PurR-regulated membrane protein YhhQ (DUF165 family)
MIAMAHNSDRGGAGALGVAIAAMAAIVLLSNILVQYPLKVSVGSLNLADLLTYGAFSYPLAFLVNDITNRRLGPARARLVVMAGFLLAVLLSIWLATPRLAIASGSAFLVAQLLDIAIFDRLRRSAWWRAPLLSSVLGSLIDTAMFFSLAFAAFFVFLGPNTEFALGDAPLLGVMSVEAPRWVSWALGDLVVKLLVTLALLAPYKYLRARLAPVDFAAANAAKPA